MADVKLGSVPGIAGVPTGANDKEKIQWLVTAYSALEDSYVRLMRDLENALQSLDSNNVKELDANITKFKNLVADTIITNTLVTQTLYAEKGYIAELTVDQLDTSDKVQRYLLDPSDPLRTAPVYYVKVFDQYVQHIEAIIEDEPATTEQVTLRDGTTLLYWSPNELGVIDHKGTTTTANDYPVTIWHYTEYIKMESTFKDIEGTTIPMTQYGVGTGTGDNGKGYAYKDALNAMHVGVYHSTTGDPIEIALDNDGLRKVGGTGDVQVRNVAISNDSPEDIPGLEDNDQQIRPDDHSSYDVQDVAEDTLLEAGGPAFVRVANGSTITLYNGLSTYNRVQNEETVCGMEIRIIRNIGDTNVTVTPGANQDYASDIVIVPGAERAFYIGYYPSGL